RRYLIRRRGGSFRPAFFLVSSGLVFPSARHLEPIQFLFHLMKGIVADLVVGAHVDDRLARGLKGTLMDVAVRGMPSLPVAIRISRRQMCGELLANGIGNRRTIALE